MGATFAAQASCVVMVAQHSTALYSSATVGGDFCLHYYSN